MGNLEDNMTDETLERLETLMDALWREHQRCREWEDGLAASEDEAHFARYGF